MKFILLDLPDRHYQYRYIYFLDNDILVRMNIVLTAQAILTLEHKLRIINEYNRMGYIQTTIEESKFYGYSGCSEL